MSHAQYRLLKARQRSKQKRKEARVQRNAARRGGGGGLIDISWFPKLFGGAKSAPVLPKEQGEREVK